VRRRAFFASSRFPLHLLSWAAQYRPTSWGFESEGMPRRTRVTGRSSRELNLTAAFLFRSAGFTGLSLCSSRSSVRGCGAWVYVDTAIPILNVAEFFHIDFRYFRWRRYSVRQSPRPQAAVTSDFFAAIVALLNWVSMERSSRRCEVAGTSGLRVPTQVARFKVLWPLITNSLIHSVSN
jgi:hypothetical protein